MEAKAPQSPSSDSEILDIAEALMQADMAPSGVTDDADEEDGEEVAEPESAPVPVKAQAPAAKKPAETPPVKDEAVSPKIAELAKMEWELTQEKKALKEEREKAAAQLVEETKSRAELASLRETVKKDKFAVLQHLGIDVTELVQDILKHGGIPQPTAKIEAAPVKDTKAEPSGEIAELKASIQQIMAITRQQMVDKFTAETTSEATKLLEQPEYDLLMGLEEPAQLITNKIKAHAEETGELLTVKQVADTLKTMWEQEVSRLKSNARFRAALGLASEEPAEKTEETKSVPKPVSKSLSNRASTTPQKTRRAAIEAKEFTDEDVAELAKSISLDWGD